MVAQTDDHVMGYRMPALHDGVGVQRPASGCQSGINEHVMLGVGSIDAVYTIDTEATCVP